jgi:hypothetical protein
MVISAVSFSAVSDGHRAGQRMQDADLDRVRGAPFAVVSPGHLLVASMPILLPSPETGEAKSR